MTSTTRFWAPFAARAALGFGAASLAILVFTGPAQAQTAEQNKIAVAARFDAWRAGTGNPFELLADEASWTIEGNSVASGPTRPRRTFCATSSSHSTRA